MTARTKKNQRDLRGKPVPRPTYPFTAIVGQEEMKLALLLNVVAPSIGGVLIMGHRGTGKSTAVRSLAELLPPNTIVRGCAYNCDPSDAENFCDDCSARVMSGERLAREGASIRVVELPLGATEDRVCGSISLERALTEGVKAFEPGLLARANRGFLYIDEVNLLDDHLVDLLLDVAVTGRNVVERESISIEHPARFVLIGSGNPEEGDLRPQLIDRFGLYTEVRSITDVDARVEIVERRESFERDPMNFVRRSAGEQKHLALRLKDAQKTFGGVEVPRPLMRSIAGLCLRLEVDGHRGEITIARAARALAGLENRQDVTADDVRRVAPLALGHRLRRDPLEQTGGGARIEQALQEILDDAETSDDGERTRASTRGNGGRNHARPKSNVGGGVNEGGENINPVTSAPSGDLVSPDTGSQQEQSAPPANASYREDARESDVRRVGTSSASSVPLARRRTGAGSSTSKVRGRYSRAVVEKDGGTRVALDATLRCAALRQSNGQSASGQAALHVRTDDLRFKLFRQKTGTLYIFAVDTSGSMALNRISQAKGALAHLLRQSYVNRDRVAVVTFRGREASLLLSPSRAPARAKRILDALPVGGATPLSAGLRCALEVAERAARQGAERIVLLVFTDGRSNVPLRNDGAANRASVKQQIESELAHIGRALRQAGVSAVVVDTRNQWTGMNDAQALAEIIGGRCVQLSSGNENRALSDLLSST